MGTSLKCSSCGKGPYVWMDNPDEMEKAKMKCKNCGSITTMEKYYQEMMKNKGIRRVLK